MRHSPSPAHFTRAHHYHVPSRLPRAAILRRARRRGSSQKDGARAEAGCRGCATKGPGCDKARSTFESGAVTATTAVEGRVVGCLGQHIPRLQKIRFKHTLTCGFVGALANTNTGITVWCGQSESGAGGDEAGCGHLRPSGLALNAAVLLRFWTYRYPTVSYYAARIILHARIPANAPHSGQLDAMHCICWTFQNDMLVFLRNVPRPRTHSISHASRNTPSWQ